MTMTDDPQKGKNQQPQQKNQPDEKGKAEELSDNKLDKVTGGRMFNPQPDPPG
jgi:bacteriocin-like protein